MNKKPEALRLARLLLSGPQRPVTNSEVAAELRRLHGVNAELVEAVKAALSDDQPYIERCKAALVKATGENNG
jgi:hypothetical protein